MRLINWPADDQLEIGQLRILWTNTGAMKFISMSADIRHIKWDFTVLRFNYAVLYHELCDLKAACNLIWPDL